MHAILKKFGDYNILCSGNEVAKTAQSLYQYAFYEEVPRMLYLTIKDLYILRW